MKTVTIITTTTATIRETWTVEVPDELEVTEITAGDLLADMDAYGATFLSVSDETLGDEGDREVLAVTS